ncbi:MAG: putative FAD-dependent dehydrogenase [Myxococcota bacterium]|jgi:uncharacterized FAD-dependent dehydrogenase
MPNYELKNLQVPLAKTSELGALAAQQLRINPADITGVELLRRSIDARGMQPRWVVNLRVWVDEVPPASASGRRIFDAPEVGNPGKVVIVGAGPAGLFAALRFADAGVPCTLLDRGAALEGRHKRSRRLRAEGVLDPESNLCFGEGGAGTYSDGKLYTRKKSKRVREVYERLVGFGGDPAVLVDAHPHLGTNRLIPLLKELREHLIEHGVEMRFNTRLDSFDIRDGRIRAVNVTAGLDDPETATQDQIQADSVIMATGHSARDTYAMLESIGAPMEAKPFAIGARVEHPQGLIDHIQFGPAAGHPALGSAEYFLRCQIGDRGVYSFCMCPGGFIIPTPTEIGHLNVNGMSNHSRKNHFANAALVVTVNPSDTAPGGNALEAVAFQRAIERKAFVAGGESYAAPATRLTDYAAGRASSTLPGRTSYRPSLTASDIGEVLPNPINRAIREALRVFDQRMHGYLSSEAVIVAAETTTSSPIRVLRDEHFECPTVAGLFPTGEGAGYAGGIVSSAIDGMRVAESILGRS